MVNDIFLRNLDAMISINIRKFISTYLHMHERTHFTIKQLDFKGSFLFNGWDGL